MESERLLYREISKDDAELIVKWRSDYDTYRYFLSPHKITVEEHLDWYKNIYIKNENRIDYIVIKKASTEPIGVFGLIYQDKTVEVNYLLDKKFRGFGYASEAVNYLINFAKEVKLSKKAIAEVHRDNFPSIALTKRIGFIESKRDGDIIIFEKEL